MDTQIVVALIGLVGIVLGAILNHWLANRKPGLKVQRRKEKEIVIYDGTKGISGYDLTANFDRCDINNGIVSVQGGDWASYVLRTYRVSGKETSFIPKNELVSGHRKFYASCEFKVINATYVVSIFLWETPEPEDGREPSIDDSMVTVKDSDWKKINFYFEAPPNRQYLVEIGTERVSGDGSLQIRNLIVTERVR